MKVLVRDAVAFDGIVEGGPKRIAGVVALEGPVEIGSPFLNCLARCTFGFADVAAAAHEGVDGAHGISLFAGKQQEGVIEIAGSRAGAAAAEGVGARFGDRQACATAPGSSWMASSC